MNIVELEFKKYLAVIYAGQTIGQAQYDELEKAFLAGAVTALRLFTQSADAEDVDGMNALIAAVNAHGENIMIKQESQDMSAREKH